MSDRYIYVDKVGAGPEHPQKSWGLFSDELTALQAESRYGLDAARRDRWFGVVRLRSGEVRPTAYLQICPRANGIVLHKLSPYGSIELSCSWGAYYTPPGEQPYEGSEERVFLAQIYQYSYPAEERFLRRNATQGHVELTFKPDGYVKDERVTKGVQGEPDHVETREFRGFDVSRNWFQIPEFGDWDAFFSPDPGGLDHVETVP